MRATSNLAHQEPSEKLPGPMEPAHEAPRSHYKCTQTDKCYMVSEAEYRWLDLCQQQMFIIDLSKNKNRPQATDNNKASTSAAEIEGDANIESMFEDISNSSTEINNNEIDALDVNLINDNEGEESTNSNGLEIVTTDEDTRENDQLTTPIITIESDDEDVEFVKVTRDITKNPNFQSLINSSNDMKRLLLQLRSTTTNRKRPEERLFESVSKDTNTSANDSDYLRMPTPGGQYNKRKKTSTIVTSAAENCQENVINTSIEKHVSQPPDINDSIVSTTSTDTQAQPSTSESPENRVTNVNNIHFVNISNTCAKATETLPPNSFLTNVSTKCIEPATHKEPSHQSLNLNKQRIVNCNTLISRPHDKSENAIQTNETDSVPDESPSKIICSQHQPETTQTQHSSPDTTTNYIPQTIPSLKQSYRPLPCIVQPTFSYSNPFLSRSTRTVNLPLPVAEIPAPENIHENNLVATNPFQVDVYPHKTHFYQTVTKPQRSFNQSVIPSYRQQSHTNQHGLSNCNQNHNSQHIWPRLHQITQNQDLHPYRPQPVRLDMSSMQQPQRGGNQLYFNMTHPQWQQHPTSQRYTTSQNTQQYLSSLHQQEISNTSPQQRGVFSSQQHFNQLAAAPQVWEPVSLNQRPNQQMGTEFSERQMVSRNFETGQSLVAYQHNIPQQYYGHNQASIRTQYPFWRNSSVGGPQATRLQFYDMAKRDPIVNKSSMQKDITVKTVPSQNATSKVHSYWQYPSKKPYYLHRKNLNP